MRADQTEEPGSGGGPMSENPVHEVQETGSVSSATAASSAPAPPASNAAASRARGEVASPTGRPSEPTASDSFRPSTETDREDSPLFLNLRSLAGPTPGRSQAAETPPVRQEQTRPTNFAAEHRALDKDGDGKVSAQDLRVDPSTFAEMDANGEGSPAPEARERLGIDAAGKPLAAKTSAPVEVGNLKNLTWEKATAMIRAQGGQPFANGQPQPQRRDPPAPRQRRHHQLGGLLQRAGLRCVPGLPWGTRRQLQPDPGRGLRTPSPNAGAPGHRGTRGREGQVDPRFRPGATGDARGPTRPGPGPHPRLAAGIPPRPPRGSGRRARQPAGPDGPG